MTTPTFQVNPSHVAAAIAKSKAAQDAALAAAKAKYPALRRKHIKAAAQREGVRVPTRTGASTRDELARAAGQTVSVAELRNRR